MKTKDISKVFYFLAIGLLALPLCGKQYCYGREFDTHWITYPKADSTSQIWFRRTYLTNEHPEAAFIDILSSGNVELYVNEYNVSNDVSVSFGTEKKDKLTRMTYDVTRFLRNDTNTIAVWFSPDINRRTDKQLSLEYYGRQIDGTAFAYHTDGDWLCRLANRRTETDGGEFEDGCQYITNWKSNDIDELEWISAAPSEDKTDDKIYDCSPFYEGERTAKILLPIKEGENESGNGILYDFGSSFVGWIRVTLREASPGEFIYVNGLTYKCNGEIDEQAYRKFTASECGKVLIYGDENFQKDQIQKVEGITLEPYFHHSYQY